MSKARIAVTGGSGFIGRHVVEALDERGFSPVIFDRTSGSDVLDQDSVDRVISTCTGVIHLAGVLGTEELFAHLDEAIDVNIKGTGHVLQACAKHHVQFVGITMPQVWDNIYQATKLACEKLASAYHRHYDMPYSHVRAYNVFGEWQKIYGVQKIVPTFATRAWKNEDIPVWGDGTQLVDLVYVKDVAAMLVDALMFSDGRIFDGGTGTPMTVREVAQRIINHTHSMSEIRYLPMRKGEHGLGVVATEGEGWEELGWRPEFREEDFSNTIDSYKILPA